MHLENPGASFFYSICDSGDGSLSCVTEKIEKIEINDSEPYEIKG